MIIRAGGRKAKEMGTDWARKLVDNYCGRFVYIKADEQCVYILKSEMAGAYKIGVAKDVHGRITILRRDFSLPDLRMVHKIYATDAGYLESFLHVIFEDKYVEVGTSTEFFNLDGDDLRWIATLSNVDSAAMKREGLMGIQAPIPLTERAALVIRIGDLRELSIEKLRRIAEIVEEA